MAADKEKEKKKTTRKKVAKKETEEKKPKRATKKAEAKKVAKKATTKKKESTKKVTKPKHEKKELDNISKIQRDGSVIRTSKVVKEKYKPLKEDDYDFTDDIFSAFQRAESQYNEASDINNYDYVESDENEGQKELVRVRSKKQAKRYKVIEEEKQKNKEKEKKNKKKNKRKRRIIIVIEIILVLIIIASAIYIFKWLSDNKSSKDEQDSLLAAVKVDIEVEDGVDIKEAIKSNPLDAKNYSIDFNTLKSKNSDTVGWLKVNNTSIEYVVVQSSDNEYYLTHSFDNSTNSAGWVFADFRDEFDGSSENIVIYGHNRKDGSMFGTLRYCLTADWFSKDCNKIIVLNTPNGKYNYQIFSVYSVLNEDYYITTDFSNNEEYQEFLNTISSRTINDFGVGVTTEDKILTLSTCSANNKYRTVVHAKLIQ